MTGSPEPAREIASHLQWLGSLCVAFTDQESRYVEVGSAFARYFGFSPDEMIGREAIELGLVPDPREAAEMRRRLADAGRVTDYEINLRTRDGKDRVGLLSIEPLVLGGRALRLSVLADVTDLRQTEKRALALNRALSMLSEANQVIIRARTPEEIFSRICRIAVEKGGVDRAWIGLVDGRTGALSPVAVVGRRGEEITSLSPGDPAADGACATGRVAESGARVVMDLAEPDESFPACHRDAWEAGFRAVAGFPLSSGGILRGVLALYSCAPGFFDAERVGMLDDLARNLSFAMDLAERESERERALLSLRESESRYRELVRTSPAAILVDQGRGVAFANPAATTLFGAASERELYGKTAFELMHPDHHEEIRGHIAQLARGVTPPMHVQKALRFDGTVRDVEVTTSIVGGSPVPEIQIVLHDITERARAIAALRDSENRLRKAQGIANVGNWEIDLAAGTMWGSEEARRIYGVVGDDPALDLGLVQEVAVPEDRPLLDSAFERLLAGTAEYDVQFRIRRMDNGALRIVHSRAECTRDASGRPVTVVGVLQDVTDRMSVQQALQDSEERLKTTLYSIADGVIATDLQGRVAQMNRAAEVLTGWSEPDAHGQPVAQVFPLIDEERGAVIDDPVARAIRDRETVTVGPGVSLFSRSGRLFSVSCSAAPIRIGASEPSGAVLVFEDKTKERELEAQVRQAQKLEAVGRLAGGIAHDYNNMVSVIQGYAELMMGDLNPLDPLRENVKAIADAASRSAGLTRQLLAFARRQAVVPVPLDLNAAIASLQQMLQRLVGEDIELRWEPAADLWITRIDPTQLDQMLANLATNSRDAIRDTGVIAIGTGNVRARNPRDPAGGAECNYVMISFQDNGCGMDKATKARIFEPFFTTKPEGRGTGLGLATVFGVVEQNNGFITVDSEPGAGTTMKIFLPRFEGTVKKAPRQERAVQARGTETILVVEDEPQLLRLARLTLEGRGYTVLPASTPAEALHACERHSGPLHLIITDVVMPGMNGRELRRRLSGLRPDARVLFMSGYTPDIVADRGVEDEGAEFLPKPFTPQVLVRRVREILDRPTDSART